MKLCFLGFLTSAVLSTLISLGSAIPADTLLVRDACAFTPGYDPNIPTLAYKENSVCQGFNEGRRACSCNGGDIIFCSGGRWGGEVHCRTKGKECEGINRAEGGDSTVGCY